VAAGRGLLLLLFSPRRSPTRSLSLIMFVRRVRSLRAPPVHAVPVCLLPLPSALSPVLPLSLSLSGLQSLS